MLDVMVSPLELRAAPASQLGPKLPGEQALALVVSVRLLDLPPQLASQPLVAGPRGLAEP